MQVVCTYNIYSAEIYVFYENYLNLNEVTNSLFMDRGELTMVRRVEPA